ncbi:PREDICTED: uncharacterized protein At4g02000-like [Camelina sativa]|uniref:Uncharacterized protein At4g02000-like n=1 Tax=Camelina sativa TaxID=90675 RepID=A0ABM0WW07_CAMSA|nr:PREDICTED: uncharacterized protein At4g02000-like [Camelina sativa]
MAITSITRNRLSLIARPLNPSVQNFQTVISSLPRSWGLASQVHGRVLDGTFIQFLFQSEVDLISVQRREPWIFNNWFVAVQRWEDFPSLDFLTTIDLWVQIRGIPLPYVSDETVVLIAERLGEIVTVDFHEATTTQIACIRVRIRFGITDCLRFFRRIRFRSGETAMIRFQYERLRRICSNCYRMTHHRIQCPFLQRIPINRVNPAISERLDQNRVVQNDELNRDDINSQSHISDTSFPAPRSQPPRVETPPLNPEEIAAASPYFPEFKAENVQHFAVPIPKRVSSIRVQSSNCSNVTPFNDHESTAKEIKNAGIGQTSKFEVGESSKHPRSEIAKDKERKQKQKIQEYKDGGIQIPPKKR